MALLDSEGFGWTTTAADLWNFGGWLTSGVAASYSISAGGPLGDNYFTTSMANGYLARPFTTSASSFFVGFRWNPNGLSTSSGFSICDASGNTQLTFVPSTTGQIAVYRGSNSGTLLGTAPANSLTSGVWQYVEVGGVINASTGSITVRVNGVAVLTLTNVNTAGNASLGVGSFRINGFSNSGPAWGSITHLYVCDGTGAAPWNTFLGDVRVQTLFPAAAASTQFQPNELVQDYAIGTSSDTSIATGTNEWRRITNTVAGTLTAIQFGLSAAITGTLLLGLYADNGSGTAPTGSALASGTLTNPGVGVASVPITGGPTLTATYYWVLVSASVAVAGYKNTSSTSETSVSAAQTFSATAPTVPSSGNTTSTSAAWKAITVQGGTNLSIVDSQPDTGNYNSSSTVGAEDLFTMGAVGATTQTVYGLTTKLIAGKSDSGSRSIAPVILSSGTTATGASSGLGTSATQTKMVQQTDPHTGAQWTSAGVNAAQIGYEVAA